MAKKKEKVDTGPAERLAHNPFAGLLGDGAAGPSTSDAPEPDAPESDDGPRFAPKVVVRRQTKGRGGKTVTRVSGVAPESLEDVTARMKKALGCGAKVEGDDVILLGDVGDRAVQWLEGAGARRVVRGS